MFSLITPLVASMEYFSWVPLGSQVLESMHLIVVYDCHGGLNCTRSSCITEYYGIAVPGGYLYAESLTRTKGIVLNDTGTIVYDPYICSRRITGSGEIKIPG